MGSRTTFNGYLRQRGTNSRKLSTATPAPMVSYLRFSFDPTAASSAQGVTVPKGARVISLVHDGGATGGVSPTVDFGWSGATDALGNEVAADGAANLTLGAATTGTSFGAVLTADREIWAGVGASAATGGTVVAEMQWVMDDDGTDGTG